METSKKILKFLFQLALLLAALAVLFFIFEDKSRVVVSQVVQQIAPCSMPVTYRVGTIDKSFHIDQKQVLGALAKASAIWNEGTGKSLLKYDSEHGSVVVNFVYDSRQATTEKLKGLGVVVGDDRQTYEAVKVRYTALFSDYQAKKAAFESSVASFTSRQNAYNAEVSRWNAKGGAPHDVFQTLEAEKASLAELAVRIEAQQVEVNTEVTDVNSLASELNHLIDVLNLDVAKFNSAGAANGPEFEEGVYQSAVGEQEINVYEYDSEARLVRLLSHELGHALGLEHVDDSKAIMYKLNMSTSNRLTATDVLALEARCARR